MPNPVLGLFISAILALIVAIFIFGTRGKYNDPDIADVFRTIGVGALAAAVTGIIDRNLLVRAIDTRIRECLKESDELKVAVAELGIHNAHKPFDFRRIFDESEAGEYVSWLDTYCPLQNQFLDGIRDAVKRGVRVRMLIVNPKCRNAERRSVELTGTPDTGEAFMHSLRSFIEKMKTFSDANPGQFEIRFYTDLPCVPMYLIGNGKSGPRKGYFSLFLSKASAHSTHIELSSGEWLANMGTYFDAKWARWKGAGPQSILPTLDE
jgi:hypothetical protein